MFGIYCTNFDSANVFGLSGGHWPSSKDANSVLSMLSCVLKLIEASEITKNARKLVLHADNCAGQNKNSYVLWFLSWLTCNGYFDEIELKFLVAGHTKNACDGTFGHIKRSFRRFEVPLPQYMHDLLSESSTKKVYVKSCDVSWVQWKLILGNFFKIPKNFRMLLYQIFKFSKESPDVLYAKVLSTAESWEKFNLLKDGQNPYNAGIECRRMAKSSKCVAPNLDLEKLESAEEGYRKIIS